MSQVIEDRELIDKQREDFLAYEGNDFPGLIIVMWVVSMAVLAGYTWYYYLPSVWPAAMKVFG